MPLPAIFSPEIAENPSKGFRAINAKVRFAAPFSLLGTVPRPLRRSRPRPRFVLLVSRTRTSTIPFYEPPSPRPLPLPGREGARLVLRSLGEGGRAGEGAVHGPNACARAKGGSPQTWVGRASSRAMISVHWTSGLDGVSSHRIVPADASTDAAVVTAKNV
jgi:hypothetical protein